MQWTFSFGNSKPAYGNNVITFIFKFIGDFEIRNAGKKTADDYFDSLFGSRWNGVRFSFCFVEVYLYYSEKIRVSTKNFDGIFYPNLGLDALGRKS